MKKNIRKEETVGGEPGRARGTRHHRIQGKRLQERRTKQGTQRNGPGRQDGRAATAFSSGRGVNPGRETLEV